MTITKNNNQSKTDSLIGVLSGIIIIYSGIPVISVYITPYIQFALLLLCLFLMYGNKYTLAKMLPVTLSVFAFLTIYFFTTPYSISDIDQLRRMYAILLFFFPLLLMYYFMLKKNHSLIKKLTVIALMTIGLTAITTYVGLSIYPDAARLLATGNREFVNIYLPLNIGGYGLIYSLVLLYPMLFYIFKTRKNVRLLVLVVIAFLFLLVIKSQYTLALLFLAFASALLLMFKRITVYKVVILCTIILLTTIITQSYISDFFMSLSDRIESRDISDRFAEIANLLEYGILEGDSQSRINAYIMSISTFIDSPMIGTWGNTFPGAFGGHSTFLDTLAVSGIIGGVSLFIIFRRYYKDILMPMKNDQAFGYILCSFILYIALSFINTTEFAGLLVFFILPGINYFGHKESLQEEL